MCVKEAMNILKRGLKEIGSLSAHRKNVNILRGLFQAPREQYHFKIENQKAISNTDLSLNLSLNKCRLKLLREKPSFILAFTEKGFTVQTTQDNK